MMDSKSVDVEGICNVLPDLEICANNLVLKWCNLLTFGCFYENKPPVTGIFKFLS